MIPELSNAQLERFFRKFEICEDTGCWDWIAACESRGYGHFYAGRYWCAHRVSYELFVGPIPIGLTLDHLCRNRRCVNPEHLEPVSHRENILRGMSPLADNARRTHCRRGHPLFGDNVKLENGGRRCLCCEWLKIHLYRFRRRQAQLQKVPATC